jgi:hypothetical protein
MHEHPLLKNQNPSNLRLDVEKVLLVRGPETSCPAGYAVAEVCMEGDERLLWRRAVRELVEPVAVRFKVVADAVPQEAQARIDSIPASFNTLSKRLVSRFQLTRRAARKAACSSQVSP